MALVGAEIVVVSVAIVVVVVATAVVIHGAAAFPDLQMLLRHETCMYAIMIAMVWYIAIMTATVRTTDGQ